MDEKHDQAVLETEEIETDANDYLSILREMQQSLSDDGESTSAFKTGSNDADELAQPELDEPAPPMFLAENNTSDSEFSVFSQDKGDSKAADYLADAPTQPLPQLSADFAGNIMSDDSVAGAETETSQSSGLIDPDEDSFSLAIASLEAIGQANAQENTDAVEMDDQSFEDFAELSPILFDASEQTELSEPDFDSELVPEASTETMPEIGMSNSSTNLLETTLTTVPETDDLPAVVDEMPTNLRFDRIFDEDLSESNTAFAPFIEAQEETEDTTALLPNLESEDFASTESFSELVTPNFEQHFEEQNLPEQNLLAGFDETAETLVSDDSADFDLPDTMFLTEDKGNNMLAPSFALLDAEQEEADPTAEMMEPDLSDFPSEDANANGSGLAVPWFLQAELLAKHSTLEDSVPEPSFSEENLADETVTAQSIAAQSTAAPEETSAAPSAAQNNYEELPEAEHPSDNGNASENGFNRFTFLGEADEMRETASFETWPTDFSEPQYSQNSPENLLTTPSENEFGVLPDNLSDEIPEALLLKDSETQTAESDLDGFDQLPEPNFEDADLSLPEPPIDLALALASSEKDLASQNVLQGKQHQIEKASFLQERFVIFKLDDTLYAFPAVNVAEIGQLLPITPLPFVPSWFLGISHLRGDILSVVGLRELWQKNTAVPHKAKILIVHSEKQSLTVALVVDAVREMRHVMPEEITSDESQNDSHFASYQIGMVDYEGQNLRLLNAEKLLETLRK